jgi:hypothetical protein
MTILRSTLLTALLATAAIALTGALAAAGAHAEPHPDHRPTYEVTADLDGRRSPAKADIARENFLREGQNVPVICQEIGERAYGSRIWDLVPDGGETLFVPDRYIDTNTDGRAREIPECDEEDLDRVTVKPPRGDRPAPPTYP